MQSQLEAALLAGLGLDDSGTNNTAGGGDDDQEDDADDVDDFIDEDCDGEIAHRVGKATCSNVITSRTAVTLQMLLSSDILQPAVGSMSIEYMGQRFVGDLLHDGKIRSQETDLVFASPSAWAIACKRFINPDKKSGCGWSSVKYKGRKLEVYKNLWYKKKKAELDRKEEMADETYMENKPTIKTNAYIPRMVVKHNTIVNRTFTHDANTLIECVPFSNLGKIQPFLLSVSTNAALLMDFHCHLTSSEVNGYLAGHWDINSHNLQITHAFPCRNTKSDRENGPKVEQEIARTIEKQKLTLVGWYHSHPFTSATPTLRDIDAQLDYQIKMKGLSDNNYTPCVGIIISPYNYENSSLESSILAYWVIPPPENKPNEYGRPMQMSYSVMQDTALGSSVKEEMTKCAEYYKKQNEIINFEDKYFNATTFIEKLKSTLISKFPQDQSETFWSFIREVLGCPAENDTVLTIPQVTTKSSQQQMLPTLGNPPTSLNSNLMLTSDIANVLFNSGKFPSASSLLGLPDPMAHSTLAANNMFLSTNMFKMQDLLKPPPVATTNKGKLETKTTLNIPRDIRSFNNDIYKTTSNEVKKVKVDSKESLLIEKQEVLEDVRNNKIDEEYSLNLSQQQDESQQNNTLDLSNKNADLFMPDNKMSSNIENSDQPMNLTANV